MHTPADAKHWRDEGTRITEDTPEPRKVEVARLYLRRCHEVGLEVIAVTDHNFACAPEHSFINYLRQENENVARELNRHPFTIFPGFEIEADVGTGHHVLCLFPANAELQLVHDRLTACDLPQDARFDDAGLPKPSMRNLRDILTVVQKARLHPGLVICPHPFGEKGMLNDDNCELWLQQEEFTNLDLLCVEVPKPVEKFNNTRLRNLIIGGEDCLPEWRRGKGETERPVAYVCSSDCYRMQKEAELRTEIESLDLSIQAKREGQQRRRTLVANKTDLGGRLARLDAVKRPLERWTTLESQDRYLKALLESCERSIGLLRTQTKDVFETVSATRLRAPRYVTPERATTGPEDSHTDIDQNPNHQVAINEAKKLIDKANAAFDKALADLKETVDKGIATFEEATSGASGLLRRVIEQEWIPLFQAERQKYEEIKRKLEERGDKPEEYLTVKSQLDTVLSSISQLDLELGEIDAMEKQRLKKLSELRAVWRSQTDARIRKARELMERLRPTPGSKPLVEIDVTHQGDVKSMVAIWSSKLRDRRRINEQDISNVIQVVSQRVEEGDQPVSLSERAIDGVRTPEMRPMLQDVLGNRLQAFLDTYTEKVLRELERDRVEDRVVYRVYRQDGSLAGTIEKVSVGQKGLAFLNLLLASGDVPLLMDTPEEGLDNEGVYAELVPVFRREKEKRQIIIATRNANLPVNADAELIVALEAVGVVDLAKLQNDSVRAIEQSGAALTRTYEEEGSVRSVRRAPKQPSVTALADLAPRMSWHKDAHEYLTESCGWSDEEASMLVDCIAEYREVYGKVRRRRMKKGGKLEECLGALDKPVVKQAVQDIMEGSEHAFRKRWEKYGF